MNNFNVNIDADAVMHQIEQETQKKTFTTFDPKNYLNTRLSPNESSKTLTIRLLPPSDKGGFPFEKVYMHTIKVSKEIAESGWKTFVCPKHNHMGDEKCPFCEIAEEAKKLMYSTLNDREKEKYKEITNNNRAKEMWIVRCIERGKEDEGVKFWLMPNSKDGAYAKIMNVWNTRWKKAQEKGTVNNIFDLNNGKDLDVTISRSPDGRNVISVVDADEKTPLTEDFELGTQWINDSKKWTDLYKIKPYNYMEIIVNGGVPVFSKEKNMYVDKEDLTKEHTDEVNSNITPQEVDFTKAPEQQTTAPITVNNDDFPF